METKEPVVNQPDLSKPEELAAATNAMYGVTPEAPIDEAESTPETKETETTQAEPESKETATVPVVDSQAELKSFFADTPFKGEDVKKSIQDAIKSYKELQGTFNQTREKVKPYEQLLDLAGTDPNFAQVLRTAEQLYRDPKLAEAYKLQQQGIVRPEPTQYDMYDPAQRQKFEQDMKTYEEQIRGYGAMQEKMQYEGKIREIEQQRNQEKIKFEFKQSHPDVDADEMEKWIMNDASKMNPLEIAYRVRNWDKVKDEATKEARGKITEKIQTASQATPTAPSAAEQRVNPEDVLKHTIRYGLDSAKKKYGEELVRNVQRDMTNAYA